MYRTIIIDDEKTARINTINMLNTFCSNIDIVDTAENVSTGIEKIKTNKPDLVLLDIDMPDGTGFDLLQQLAPIDFMVIFITAHAEHALTAIKFNALDFIVKPLDPEELLLAISKVAKQKNDTFYQQRINNLLNEKKKGQAPRIAIGNSDALHFVSPNDIVHIEADANYSHIYLNDGKKVTVSKPLKEFANMLDNDDFFRPHQSHLINLNYLKEYKKKDGGYIKLSTNETIPMSARKKEKLVMAYKNFNN